MSILHYSPKDVKIVVAGLYQVEGYAEGTFINITRNTRAYESTRAMDGEIARVCRKDGGYTLEITVAQSSRANDIFSALYNIDTATQIGKFPLFIKDQYGSTSFMSLSTWIEDLPSVTFSGDLETRTWVLGCAQATLHVGGNEQQALEESVSFFGISLLPLLRDFGVPL